MNRIEHLDFIKDYIVIKEFLNGLVYKALPPGTIRQRGSGRYQKQESGEWTRIKTRGQKEKEDKTVDLSNDKERYNFAKKLAEDYEAGKLPEKLNKIIDEEKKELLGEDTVADAISDILKTKENKLFDNPEFVQWAKKKGLKKEKNEISKENKNIIDKLSDKDKNALIGMAKLEKEYADFKKTNPSDKKLKDKEKKLKEKGVSFVDHIRNTNLLDKIDVNFYHAKDIGKILLEKQNELQKIKPMTKKQKLKELSKKEKGWESNDIGIPINNTPEHENKLLNNIKNIKQGDPVEIKQVTSPDSIKGTFDRLVEHNGKKWIRINTIKNGEQVIGAFAVSFMEDLQKGKLSKEKTKKPNTIEETIKNISDKGYEKLFNSNLYNHLKENKQMTESEKKELIANLEKNNAENEIKKKEEELTKQFKNISFKKLHQKGKNTKKINEELNKLRENYNNKLLKIKDDVLQDRIKKWE